MELPYLIFRVIEIWFINGRRCCILLNLSHQIVHVFSRALMKSDENVFIKEWKLPTGLLIHFKFN